MGRKIMFIVLLAAGLTASAWLGFIDSQADAAAKTSRDSLNTATIRRTAITPVNQGNGAGRGNAQYQQAYMQQKVYQSTRSLVPIAKPPATQTTGNRRGRVTEAVPEQDFSRYAAEARRARGTIVFQPVGDLPHDQKKALPHMMDAVSAFFGMPTVCASPITLAELPRNYTRVVDGERQINGEALMNNILRPNVGGAIACVIAITADSIYAGDRSSATVRAMSSYTSGTAVISTVDALDNSPADRGKNLLRLCKMATHELCHTYTLKHCVKYDCLMNNSTNPREAELRPFSLCPDCLAKLSLGTGREPSLHLEDMLGLCKSKGFSAEARYYLKALGMLK